MICPKCKGIGFEYIIQQYGSIKIICDFCWGKEDLDWIENVIGVETYYFKGRIIKTDTMPHGGRFYPIE